VRALLFWRPACIGCRACSELSLPFRINISPEGSASMDNSNDYIDLQPGMEVFSRDGEKVGKVVSLDNTQLTVEKGFIFHQDVVIPMNAVEGADERSIYLNVTKDEALNQQWGDGATTGGADYARRDTMNTDAAMGAADRTTAAQGSTATAGDKLVIPVHEEELTATKRSVDAGQVQIDTGVVSEDRTLNVPITEERVRVTRRAVDREATGGEAAFEGGTINVPVRSEEVDMQKRVRVAEEVEMAKEAVQKTKQVSGTVRREVVNVTDKTDGDVIDGTSGAVSKGPRQ